MAIFSRGENTLSIFLFLLFSAVTDRWGPLTGATPWPGRRPPRGRRRTDGAPAPRIEPQRARLHLDADATPFTPPLTLPLPALPPRAPARQSPWLPWATRAPSSRSRGRLSRSRASKMPLSASPSPRASGEPNPVVVPFPIRPVEPCPESTPPWPP